MKRSLQIILSLVQTKARFPLTWHTQLGLLPNGESRLFCVGDQVEIVSVRQGRMTKPIPAVTELEPWARHKSGRRRSSCITHRSLLSAPCTGWRSTSSRTATFQTLEGRQLAQRRPGSIRGVLPDAPPSARINKSRTESDSNSEYGRTLALPAIAACYAHLER